MSKKIQRICMLSAHGYVDPVPQLGQTDTGGQVVYVLELSRALSRKGYHVDIFTRWFDEQKKQVDPLPGNEEVNVIRIHCGPWEFVPKEEIYNLLPELSQNMARYISDHHLEYDVFHSHYVDAGIVSLDVARHFKKPVFFTPHSLGAWKREQMGGDPVEAEQKYNFNHRIAEEQRIIDHMNAVTVTSEVQRERLLRLYHYTTERIVTIPPGVNIRAYHLPDGHKKKIKTSLPGKYIYCLSRIDDNKGHDLLLRAFDKVRKEINDIWLVIGGGSPHPKEREKKLFEKMHKIISELGMEDRVKIIGYVPDKWMATYYQQAELFVLPSLFEPFGMTTQEAMSCGKPVIASKYGGIRNIITHGVNGLLVDPQNDTEFANAMIQLLKDDEMKEQIGMAAHCMIRENYCWEIMAEKHIDLYTHYQ